MRQVNYCPQLTHSEDRFLGPYIDRACIKPPRGAPWKPVRSQRMVHIRNSGKLFTHHSIFSTLVSHLDRLTTSSTLRQYTASATHIHCPPHHSCRLYTILDPLKAWGEQGKPHSPHGALVLLDTRGRCKLGGFKYSN